MSFKDHFSAKAADYAKSRPSYPAELALWLAENSPGRTRALDVGCGSGQLSVLLATHFADVVATDASAEQVAHATAHPRVRYAVAPAERCDLPDGSCDLITAAQAAHWFDLPAFYAEARRVARPGALLALISYGRQYIEGCAPADAVLQTFYGTTLGAYWPPERRHVELGYQSLPFPFADREAPNFVIRRDWTADALLAYVDSWSAMRAAEKTIGRDPYDSFAAELRAAWPQKGAAPLTIIWPIAMRLATLP